jgi:hypothetical protein
MEELLVQKQYNPHHAFSNLFLGSAVKLVFYRSRRPWALFSLHALFLLLWEIRSCGLGNDMTCENPTYPVRKMLESFGLWFPEITSIITMCLLVVSFYCNTCIGMYREMYFSLTNMSTR